MILTIFFLVTIVVSLFLPLLVIPTLFLLGLCDCFDMMEVSIRLNLVNVFH